MAVVQCDIRRGRTQDQKRLYGEALTRAVHEITGLDIDNILVIFRERRATTCSRRHGAA